MRRLSASCALLSILHPFVASAQTTPQTPAGDDQPPSEVPTIEERVEVVGVTPIHGLGVSKASVPANIQVATAADLEGRPGLHVTDLLVDGFSSVSVNETQSNPFQPDIQFRGFSASPLLGLPQGVAVYQNGVRVNEPFGDTVNWDLLPTNAIASINLIPGSNPLFGLNALGGALSVQTKTGFTDPGHSVQLTAGSFGRVWADFQSAAHDNRLSYFLAGRILGERGWRDFSNSRLRGFFGGVEWQGGGNALGASVTAGANRLIGNGPAPVGLLADDRRQVFTHPDETKTELGLVTLTGRRLVGSAASVDGVLFYRPARVRTFNGDDTNYGPCDDDDFAGLLCEDDGGEPVQDQFGRPIRIGADPFDATNNTSRTRSRGWGGGLQATVAHPLGDRPNSFIAGVSLDAARARYDADTELARLTETRGTVGVGLFDREAAVRLRTRVWHTGVYAADFFTVAPRTTLMASARFTHSRLTLLDELGGELDGRHAFTRLNPAVGITVAVTPEVTAFGSVSVASRVPTPSELGCADSDAPCRLPNAFVADPPLEQVVARTWEGGVRGQRRSFGWSASLFRTRNSDDIIFVSSGSLTNLGHFENIGDTLRQGLEVAVGGRPASSVELSVGYSYLRATFDSALTLSSPNHPESDGGELRIAPGSSLPGVPRHSLKSEVVFALGRASWAASLVAMSSQPLRGDEANLLPPVEGFATVGLAGGYALSARAKLVGRLVNLLNTEYETFGLLGEADDVLGEDFDDPRFLSPAAPRAAWIGVEFGF